MTEICAVSRACERKTGNNNNTKWCKNEERIPNRMPLMGWQKFENVDVSMAVRHLECNEYCHILMCQVCWLLFGDTHSRSACESTERSVPQFRDLWFYWAVYRDADFYSSRNSRNERIEYRRRLDSPAKTIEQLNQRKWNKRTHQNWTNKYMLQFFRFLIPHKFKSVFIFALIINMLINNSDWYSKKVFSCILAICQYF